MYKFISVLYFGQYIRRPPPPPPPPLMHRRVADSIASRQITDKLTAAVYNISPAVKYISVRIITSESYSSTVAKPTTYTFFNIGYPCI